MKYTYKDFVTGKIRFTRGRFAGWTKETGLMSVPYAVFERKGDTLLIPRYLLTAETKAALNVA